MQSKTGRLESDVKNNALDIINTGKDLARWDDDLIPARKKVLLKLKNDLVGPPKTSIDIIIRIKSHCPWREGELVAYNFFENQWVILRVCDIRQDRGGSWPMMEILDWIGVILPEPKNMMRLKLRELRTKHEDNTHYFYLFGFSGKRFPKE